MSEESEFLEEQTFRLGYARGYAAGLLDAEAVIRQKIADALNAQGQGPSAQMVQQVKINE